MGLEASREYALSERGANKRVVDLSRTGAVASRVVRWCISGQNLIYVITGLIMIRLYVSPLAFHRLTPPDGPPTLFRSLTFDAVVGQKISGVVSTPDFPPSLL